MVDAHVTSRRMPAMKPVGERSAGNPHAAFDERGGETDRTCGTAPLLDSTAGRFEKFGLALVMFHARALEHHTSARELPVDLDQCVELPVRPLDGNEIA